MSNSNKPSFHPKYKITIDWDQGNVEFYAKFGEEKSSLRSFTFDELDSNDKIVISDGNTVIVVKRTRKGDRFSCGILDKNDPEEQQKWKNYLTAKLVSDKSDYALFTFDS
ncbi:MAG: hypothetical protein ACTSQE_00730 [Candidatus Heimdallarchaeaceae archaeon]